MPFSIFDALFHSQFPTKATQRSGQGGACKLVVIWCRVACRRGASMAGMGRWTGTAMATPTGKGWEPEQSRSNANSSSSVEEEIEFDGHGWLRAPLAAASTGRHRDGGRSILLNSVALHLYLPPLHPQQHLRLYLHLRIHPHAPGSNTKAEAYPPMPLNQMLLL